jgi:hypothetical protein
MSGKSNERMTKMKKVLISIAILVVLLIGVTTAAVAASGLNDRQADRLGQLKIRLEDAVKDGRLTQAEADERYTARQEWMESRAAECDGTCDGTGDRACDGTRGKTGFGAGLGQGQGRGMGRGGMNGCGGTGNCVK